MLNVTGKSENETFLILRICEFTETWVVTQRDIKGHIKSYHSKEIKIHRTILYDCKRFFRLDGTCNWIVELSNSMGWDFERRILWMICPWYLWYRSRFQHRASSSRLASHFPLFSSRDQQAEVGSLLRMGVILPNTSLLLNTLRQKKNDLMK